MKNNTKGDLTITKVMSDLIERDYVVFFPISEHSTVDLVGIKDNICTRFQVKTCKNGVVRHYSTFSTKAGVKAVAYKVDDFDYYALYNHALNKVVYVPSQLGGITLSFSKPLSKSWVYWYEDFLDIREFHSKRLIGR